MDDQGFLKPPRGFATTAIHHGQNPDKWDSRAIVPPIVNSSTFKQEVPGAESGFVYTRCGNPTRNALEEVLAALEGGKCCFTFASGLGASSTIMALLSSGDHIISIDDIYGGTNSLLREVISRKGIEVSFIDATNLSLLEKAIKPNTKMVWIETPTNPTLKVVDIAATARLVKNRCSNIIIVVDNTFLTPYLQRPLEFGADIVLYSLTKYMNGHTDVLMGAAIANDTNLIERLRFLRNALGNVPSPIDCYLVNRSLKTLSFRMERHKTSGLLVARWLENHPKVVEVKHPVLKSHKQYEISKRQTAGHSGCFSFKHCGGLHESKVMLLALRIFTLAVSLGGYESLAEIPSIMTHANVPEKQREQLGISHGLIRISIGLEDVEDLIEDLAQAFEKAFPEDQGFLQPRRGFATAAIHHGQEPEKWKYLAIVPPIVNSTTFKQTAPGEHCDYEYGRSGNPTRNTLEECLAALDGGKYGFTFASGLGAITTIMALLSSGDHVISIDDVYGGTSRLLRQVISRKGIDVTFADVTVLSILNKAIQPNTKMVWLESPTNPNMKVVDIAATVKLVKSRGDIIVVLDNTFLTPYLQRPLDFGVDIVMYSLTKYMNGHSDVIMGAAIVSDESLADQLRFLQNSMGVVPSPMDCYLVNRSLKTLCFRMERHKESAILIARWLENHPKVVEVKHPGLPSHKQHEIAKRQTAGHSGVLSFKHCGDLQETRKFLCALKVFSLAESLGGYESLAGLPSIMTHASVPEKQREALGITNALIRLSVGLEDAEDLIDDLAQAFEKAF